MQLLPSASFLVFAALSIQPLVAQATIRVPVDASTIAGAFASAASGDTILVDPGVYFEHDLDFGGRTLTVRSSAGPRSTYIVASGLGRVFVLQNQESASSRIEGFTIQDGRAPAVGGVGTGQPGQPGNGGGAILVSGGSSPTIQDCVFLDNRASNGGLGGSGLNGADGTNEGDGDPGGPGALGGPGGCGGAIAVEGASTPRILNCVFRGNRAGDGGRGGIGGAGGDGDGCSFLCEAGDGGDGGSGGMGGPNGTGGAVCVESSSSATIVYCTFTGNGPGVPGVGGQGGPRGDGGNGFPDGQPGQDGPPGSPGTPLSGGAFDDRSDSSSLTSSICWTNGSIPILGAPLVTYCTVEFGFAGIGNLSADPLFVAGSTQLSSASPCIDAGDPAAAFAPAFDLDGEPRVAGPAVDMGADEFLPAPATSTLGCGVNPVGSLSILHGTPSPGSLLVFGVDNPLGTQAPGAIAAVFLSLLPDPLYPCGTSVTGFGMGGPGAIGEFLIDYSTAFGFVSSRWFGPGTPAPTLVPVPDGGALFGITFYAQGVLLDLTAAAGVPIGMTDGIEFTLGL